MIRIKGDQPLTCLPVKVLPTEQGIILKRGCTEVQIRGENVSAVIDQIFSSLVQPGISKDSLVALFPTETQPLVAKLVDQLIDRRLLVPDSIPSLHSEVSENNTDIFYWHFDQNGVEIRERLHTQKITILGVNYISKQLITSLWESGFTNLEVVDEPELRNLRLFDAQQDLASLTWPSSIPAPIAKEWWEDNIEPASLDCVISTCDFGSPPVLREWNTYCVQHNLRFLPIVLSNLVGQIGPLIIPKETACFECLVTRQDSHLGNPSAKHVVDSMAFESQTVVGFHPSMASILGNVAAMELTKFYSQALPLWNVGKLIEVNLLSTRMITRKVLKLPRCPVCGPLQTHSAVTTEKPYSQFTFSQAQS